uniref:Uncharacterized protein n=1 Tax=Noctiluca scintillans TaxID=2966 RepID=A0A7S1AN33_NOCSC
MDESSRPNCGSRAARRPSSIELMKSRPQLNARAGTQKLSATGGHRREGKRKGGGMGQSGTSGRSRSLHTLLTTRAAEYKREAGGTKAAREDDCRESSDRQLEREGKVAAVACWQPHCAGQRRNPRCQGAE